MLYTVSTLFENQKSTGKDLKKAEQRWWSWYMRNGGIDQEKNLVYKIEGKMNGLKKVNRK